MNGSSRSYPAGFAVAILASLLIVWTTIVRDDGNGIGFFMVIMAAGVAGFAASFRPTGMARAMLGVAGMQILLGIAIATAPVIAKVPGESFKFMLSGGFFAALWLVSALCFASAARASGKAALAH